MADTLERVTKIIVDRLGVDEADVKLEASLMCKTPLTCTICFLIFFGENGMSALCMESCIPMKKIRS